MSVNSILKGIGKKGKKLVSDKFPKSNNELMKGPFQRLTGKGLKDPMALYYSAVPYHIANKYTVPLAVGGVAIAGVSTGLKMNNQANMGRIEAGEGLSGMTEGTIDMASANVITPYLKELNDGSSSESRVLSAQIRDGMQHNINTSGAEGDLVFALHQMR